MPGDQPSIESRRQSPRLPVDGRLRTRIATLHLDVEMRDVSFGGFLVASPMDIATGDVHVFEVTTRDGDTHTLRARVVHCHGPRGTEASYLSGWRCSTDDTTNTALARIIEHLTEEGGVETQPATAPSRKVLAVWQMIITIVSVGRVAGHATICPEVRYAAVRWHVAPQIDRRFGSSAMWRAMAEELAGGNAGTRLPADSVTSALLLPEALRGSCALEVQDRPTITAASRDALTEALDRHLWHVDDPAPAVMNREGRLT